MLQALIFDFNGVIADDEPLHLKLFQRVLGEEGVPLSETDYYEKNYLGLDDRGCFEAVLRAHGKTISEADLRRLIERKAGYYQEAIQSRMILFPGVADFIKRASERHPLAIVSGALREEILLILERAGLRGCFRTVVSAEDVREGKPSPEGFSLALRQLNEQPSAGSDPISPGACLVLEDSPPGIAAAKTAGMRCLAVTNSYSPEKLEAADAVVRSLEGLAPEELESLIGQPVLAYCPDLLFRTRISEAGRRVGLRVQTASSLEDLEERARVGRPSLILIDLAESNAQLEACISRLRGALPDSVLIAYGSHVEKKIRDQALQAGCHQVLVRSEFVKVLPELLKSHVTAP